MHVYTMSARVYSLPYTHVLVVTHTTHTDDFIQYNAASVNTIQSYTSHVLQVNVRTHIAAYFYTY